MHRLLAGFVILVTALLITSLIWPTGTSARDNVSLAGSCLSRDAGQTCVIAPRRPAGGWMMSQSDELARRCVHQCILDSCLPIPTSECHQRCRKRCDAKH